MTEWELDCMYWMGQVLTGDYAHWCPDWDDLPIDETCLEFSCCCCYRDDPQAQVLKARMRHRERQEQYEELFK